MDPSLTIPLRFVLEFVGVATAAGLLAWALQRARKVPVAAIGALVIVQVAIAGQFAASEEAVRALASAGAMLAIAIGILMRPAGEAVVWYGGWTLVVASRIALALDASPAADLARTPGLLWHAIGALGFIALAAWVWRRALTLIRLRIIGAFALVLFLVVLLGGGAVVQVVAGRVQAEELERAMSQATAERSVLRVTNEDVLNRATLVAQTMAAIPSEQVGAAAADLLERVFTDLSFIALFAPDRAVIGQAGLSQAEVALLAGGDAVTAALQGQAAPSLERLPGAVAAVGATTVFSPGPVTPDNIRGAVALGRRFDQTWLEGIEQRTGLQAALVAPSSGEVIASSGPGLAELVLPAEALQRIDEVAAWQGSAAAGDRTFFVAAVPLERADATVPAALLLASPDTALAATTLDVSRALFAGVLAATLIAVLVALWLGARISRPILLLTAAARRVEQGELEIPDDIGSADEIGTLGRAMRSMTTSLRDTLASEREARGQLQAVVEGVGEGLVAMDADYNILSFNPAAEAITGVPSAEAVGRKCHAVYGHLTATADGRPICDVICPLRHDGGSDGSVAARTPDGRSLTLAVTCTPLRDGQGNLVGGVDLLRDVTPQVQAERMKTNFLSNISHELRTPLTPIRGFAEVMRRENLPREQSLDYLGEIVENSKRLEAIIQILVDVASMEAGRLRARPQPVDPAVVVRAAAERWKPRSDIHRVRARVARGLPMMVADERLVGRALDQLLDNALKFSPDGGPVLVEAGLADDGVELAVSDRGIGISDEDRKRLFQEFVQLDGSETRKFGGLGVGLSFVRRVAADHNGSLQVDSRPGAGTRFSLVLPAAGSEQSSSRSGRRRAPARGRSRRSGASRAASRPRAGKS